MRLTPKRQALPKSKSPNASARKNRIKRLNKKMQETNHRSNNPNQEKMFRSVVLDQNKHDKLYNQTAMNSTSKVTHRKPTRASAGVSVKRRGLSSNVQNKSRPTKADALKSKRTRDKSAPKPQIGYSQIAKSNKRTKTPKNNRSRSTNTRKKSNIKRDRSKKERSKSNNTRQVAGLNKPKRFLKTAKKSEVKSSKKEVSQKKRRLQELNERWHRKKQQKTNKFDVKNSKRRKSPLKNSKRVARDKSAKKKTYAEKYGSNIRSVSNYKGRSRSANPRSRAPKPNLKSSK